MALNETRPLKQSGEYDISPVEQQLTNEIFSSIQGDNRTAWRYRTIVRMNPYMADNPQAVAAMAAMPIRSDELMGQAGALYGMTVGNGMANMLKNYSPSIQRSIFGQLTPIQQSSLNSLGYSPPTSDVHGTGLFGEIISKAAWPVAKVFGGIGKAAAPVFGPALNAMYQIGDAPFKVYRTIKQLDDASQWIALASGLATAGGILLAPLTGGGSAALAAALTYSRVGLAFTAGMAAAGATSFLSSAIQTGGTSTWVNAWSNAYDGEKLFSQRGIETAEKFLEDPSLVAIAQDLAAESEYPGSLLGIAKELAGERGASDQKVMHRQLEVVAGKYANPGTPQFQQAYDLLSELLTLPAFTNAVVALEKSKISIGRDLTRAVGLDPSSGAGRILSGSIDGLNYLLFDPFIAVGMTARGMAQMRRGLQFVETTTGVERIRQIAHLPEMQRKFGVVAEAVEAGDIFLLDRGAKEYRPIFDELMFHKATVKPKGTYKADDVVDWIVGTDKLKSIMKGVGVIPGASYGQLRGLNRGQYAFAQVTGSARDMLRGIADIRLENLRAPQILRNLERQQFEGATKDGIDALIGFGLKPEAAELVAGFTSNLEIKTIFGQQADSLDNYVAGLDDVTRERVVSGLEEARSFLGNVQTDALGSYRVGRIIGSTPIVNRVVGPFANFVEGITTKIPGSAIYLAGLEAPDDIRNFVELFRYVGMPSYVRRMWTNSILQAPEAGMRLNAITSLLDSAVTATGMRTTKAGNDLINTFLEHVKQSYSLGRVGRYEMNLASGVRDLPIGTRPIADMADMIPIPDLREMRRAVRQGRLTQALLGISDNTHILSFQNRFWKPAVLLRAGFILRNVGEETLSMLVRYGTGKWAQELAGRNIAQLEEFFRAEERALMKNQVSYLTPYEQHVLRMRYDAPIGLRPLVRAIDRIPDGQPWQKVLKDMSRHVEDFVVRKNLQFHEFLLNGVGGQFALRLKNVDRLALENTVRGRMNNIFGRLAFGNEFAMRRMIIGGINETILNDMRAFENVYLKSIMEKVGTTNLAPWQRASNRAEEARRLLVDENGHERIALVNISGERGLSTRSNPVIGQQPWHEAELGRIQGLSDDPVISAMLNKTALIYDADLERTLPEINFIRALQEWADFKLKGQRFDEPLLQLFFILNQGTPSPARFQAALRRMTFTPDDLEKMLDRPNLYKWANERNELIRFVQDSYPGVNVPTWDEFSNLLATKYERFTGTQFVRRAPATEINVPRVDDHKAFPGYPVVTGDDLAPNLVDLGELEYDKILFQGGYSRWQSQLFTFDRIAQQLAGADAVARDRMTTLLLSWHADPTLLNYRNIMRLQPGMNRAPATATVFRGMQFDHLFDLDGEGNLILTMTPRDWTNNIPAVSFTLNDFQARKYVDSYVGGRPEANEINALLSFNLDQVLEANGLTIDDLIGGLYNQNISHLLKIGEGGTHKATIANPPNFPFDTALQSNPERREFSIQLNSASRNSGYEFIQQAQQIKPNLAFANEVSWALYGYRGERGLRPTDIQAIQKVGDDFETLYNTTLRTIVKDQKKLQDEALTFSLANPNLAEARQAGEGYIVDRSNLVLVARHLDGVYSIGDPRLSDALPWHIAQTEIKKLDELAVLRAIQDRGETVTRETLLREVLKVSKVQKEIVDPARAMLVDAGVAVEQLDDFAIVKTAQMALDHLSTRDNVIKLINDFNPAKSSKVIEFAPKQAQLVIPRGAWALDEVNPLAVNNPKVAALLESSTPQGHWPFYNNLDDVRKSMEFDGHLASASGEWDSFLKKNRDYLGMPETQPIYVLDTRPMNIGRSYEIPAGSDEIPFGARPGARVGSFENALENIADIIVQRNPESLREVEEALKKADAVFGDFEEYRTYPHVVLAEAIVSALSEQTPLVFKTQEAAEFVKTVIGDYFQKSGQGFQGEPLIALRHISGEIDSTQRMGMPTARLLEELIPADPSHPLRAPAVDLITWNGPEYQNNPLVWDWLDSIEEMPGPASIIKRAMDHVDQSIRSGRRLKLYYRESPNTPEVYRNIAGDPVKLLPGEEIQADDILFSTPKMRAQDRVLPDNQVYFEQGDVTFEGSTELLWPILAPTRYDHLESNLGWSLYDLKGDVTVPNIGDKRTRIFTDRTRLRYASTDHVAKTAAGDLPDWEIVQLYKPINQRLWDRVVNYGFNNVVGPIIDSVVRKPMAAHAFHIAAERNRNLIKWMIQSSPEEAALRSVMADVHTKINALMTEESAGLWEELGRHIGKMHGVETASKWDQTQALAYLRGLTKEEFDDALRGAGRQIDMGMGNLGALTGREKVRVKAQLDFAELNFAQLHGKMIGNTTDDFLRELERMYGRELPTEGLFHFSINDWKILPEDTQQIFTAIDEKSAEIIQKSLVQRKNVNEEVYQYAAEHVVRDIMPYVDSHEIRSQFADSVAGLLPFWYAEENFLKRWSKIFTEGGPAVSLERIRKLQLTYQGLKSVGIVRTDAQGKDYFVYPGSELLFTAIDKIFPGHRLPVTALLQTPTTQLVPGFNRDFGRPSVSPLAGITLDLVTTLFPEAQTFEEAVIGKEYVYRNIVDAIVPRHIANVWQALGDVFNTDLNPKNERIASAMMAAIAHLEANDQGLPDEATPAQRDEFLRKVRDHARVIVFAQAIGGFFTSGPANLLQTTEGGSLDWITNGQVTDPAELFASDYYELIRNLGVEKGTQRYLEINQNASLRTVLRPLAYTVSKTTTPSGAPLPSTDEALNFYTENQNILNQYPEAGPWLLPQSSDNEPRSQFAYNSELVSGLRDRRTPQEFLTTMKYKEGASEYFMAQKIYEQQYKTLKLAGRDSRASELNNQWLVWAETYKASHPLFAEMLVSDDARTRRNRVMEQIRYAIGDPNIPKASHFEALATLQRSYDAFSVARSKLTLDRTARGVMASQALKKSFASWVNDFLVENPMVLPYWVSVLEPESGLE